MQDKTQNNFNNGTMTANIPQFLVQAEAAKILCKHPRWLERKRWEGGGPAFRYIGRTPVYDLKDLLIWIDAQPVIHHTPSH